MEKTEFSFFQGGIGNIVPTKNITLQEAFRIVQSSDYKTQIEAIRKSKEKSVIDELKKKLDYFVFGVVIKEKRSSSNIERYSGLICLDFDNVADLEKIKGEVCDDKYVTLCFLSPSGNGLKVVAKIATTDFKLAWEQLAGYFRKHFGIEADKSGKDAVRACFVSYDPNAHLNLSAAVYTVKSSTRSDTVKYQKSDLERARLVAERITTSVVDITEGYDNWLKIGFALATFGEDGREIFHQVSSKSISYHAETTDQKFSDCLKNGKFVSPAYFFKAAKDAGIAILKKSNIESSAEPIIRNELYIKDSIITYDLQNFEITIRSGKGVFVVAENFLVFIKFQTKDEKERITWIIEIRRPEEDNIYITVPHDDLFDARAIEKIFGGYKLSFSLNPLQLQKLRKFLFDSTTFPMAKSVLRYGMEPTSELYFFSNLAISKAGEILRPDIHGVINYDDQYFKLPNFQKGIPSAFEYSENKVTFNDWFELFSNAQGEYIGFLTASFLLFSIFRDVGIKANNFSPILFITGVAGSGKSTTFIHLNYVFGTDGKGMTVNLKGKNTEAAVVAKMEQRYNGFQFADDYYPNHPLTPLFQASFDNKAYSKLNQFSENHIDTIDLIPKCTVGIASNFLPDLPSDEPFFSRLILIFNNNRNPSEFQKAAYKKLQVMEQEGITSVLRQLWSYRDIIKKDFKRTYDELKSAFEETLVNYQISNHRYTHNVAQLLSVPYILATRGLITMTDETDLLNFFLEHGKKAILTSESISKDKSSLQEFFGVVQELLDKGSLVSNVHYRLHGSEVTVNFRRIYQKFEFEFRRLNRFEVAPPSIHVLREELLQLVNKPESEFFKKLRFVKENEPGKIDFARDSFSVDCRLLKEKFDFEFS
ncbi:BT4734/BF3469 family protein [Dyadobacter sediminis]|uniref:Uncharacterized protein n=1 Tax=Dyadobacter sediminis TaxID=1493691 RepID=A0A5R9KK14_9BACT|nr:BT4734/BF3469 family protein [Dyadobacter sediminis]TLU96560.1 hypothetical protein FEM55_05365 [Dyadobacter sediminis]GGB83244.1 hypothetical protein GCM10011325_08490 [Dyadobacter sediminis]